ncbi:hypothetical protein LCGC14_1074330 [marine sediment metagenome]|uniref:Uncharacterized protein n=1 Tax=marine sediment metagenome TaxID=412755 RepID=A0A0F9Q0A0_9ZZZZ
MINEVFNSNHYQLITALKTPRFIIALKKYFFSLISLITVIISHQENKEKISPTKLINDFNLTLPFGRKVIERILKSLKYYFPKDFDTYI